MVDARIPLQAGEQPDDERLFRSICRSDHGLFVSRNQPLGESALDGTMTARPIVIDLVKGEYPTHRRSYVLSSHETPLHGLDKMDQRHWIEAEPEQQPAERGQH